MLDLRLRRSPSKKRKEAAAAIAAVAAAGGISCDDYLPYDTI